MIIRKDLTVFMGYGDDGGGLAEIENLDADFRTTKVAYENGPSFPVGRDGKVRIELEVNDKGTATKIYQKLQTSLDGEHWVDHCAGTLLTVVGSAPDQELQSETLPLVQLMVPASGKAYGYTFKEVETALARIAYKSDANDATIRSKVGVFKL